MLDRPAAPARPSRPNEGGRRPRRPLLDALARVPLPVVVVLLLVGALLAGLQSVWIGAVHSAGAAEPPQWLSRVTVMQVNLLVPLALIMLWARRRTVQRRLGAVGAAMLLVLPAVHLLLTIAAIIWGGILGRGDLTYPFMYVELLGLISYAGIAVSAVAWMLDRAAPRLIGPLIVAGFVLNYIVPWGLMVGYGALAVVLLTKGVVRKTRVPDAAASVS